MSINGMAGGYMRFGGLIVAIVLAAVAAVIVLRTSATDAPSPAAAVTGLSNASTSVNVYVAAKDIPVGAKITQEMIAVQPWPENLVLEGFVRADSAANTVVDSIARGAFRAQEPIIASKLANANDPNFLADDLPKGMRVITIATNEIEGVAGFVFPGDRVDIFLTRDIDRVASTQDGFVRSTKPEPVTETLLNNVAVVAVDQRASNTGALDKEGKLVIPRSVSLMVTPSDAQRLRLGAKAGTLTMALRGIADQESVDPLIITGISDISQAQSGGSGSDGILVLRGAPGDGKEFSVTPSSSPSPSR